MNKCFITKLPSSVDNDNLPVLGQLKINWLKQSNLADNDARAMGLSTNDSIVVNVSGAHFTDETLTNNIGNTKTITAADGKVWLYLSNDSNSVLTIDNKYSLTELDFNKPYKGALKHSVYFDIEDIEYCTNLVNMRLTNTQVSGNVNAVSKLTNLTILGLADTKVNGDISAISKLTNLTALDLADTKVNGDISAISKLTNLTILDLADTKVNGDISAISKLTNLTALRLNNTQISGDVDNLANLTKLSLLDDMQRLSLTGDMSKIPANVVEINQTGRLINTNFTWTAKGRQNVNLLRLIGYIPFDTVSMDNMFIDQATCTYTEDKFRPWTNSIAVSGTRTSASDAAITAIQNMGVTILGVTKAS